MRKKSNIVLVVGLLLVGISLLFPPWIGVTRTGSLSPTNYRVGYAFILTPPKTYSQTYSGPGYGTTITESFEIDWPLLSLQLSAILVIMLAVWFVVRQREQKTQPN